MVCLYLYFGNLVFLRNYSQRKSNSNQRNFRSYLRRPHLHRHPFIRLKTVRFWVVRLSHLRGGRVGEYSRVVGSEPVSPRGWLIFNKMSRREWSLIQSFSFYFPLRSYIFFYRTAFCFISASYMTT